VGRGWVTYTPTEAAVAFDDGTLIGALFERAVNSDCGRHGAAVAAAMVRLTVLEALRGGLGAGKGGGNILWVEGVTVEAGDIVSGVDYGPGGRDIRLYLEVPEVDILEGPDLKVKKC
jgi:hypothetical protein